VSLRILYSGSSPLSSAVMTVKIRGSGEGSCPGGTLTRRQSTLELTEKTAGVCPPGAERWAPKTVRSV